MTADLQGPLLALLGGLSGVAALVALAAGWAGWRHVRQGQWSPALFSANALALAALACMALVVTGGMRSPADPWLALLAFGIGPALAGHALGCLGALMTRRAP